MENNDQVKDKASENGSIELVWGTVTDNPEVVKADTETKESKVDALSVESLPSADKAIIENFVKNIDITDTNAIITYGADSQNKVASFSDSVLKNVRTKDAGDSGKLLSNLVVEIKSFDATTSDSGGLFGLFKSARKQFEKISAQYSKVDTNIEKITDELEEHKRKLLKDIAILDEMYDNNYVYFKELTMYIIAGKEKIAQVNSDVIPVLQEKAELTKDEIDIQKLSDMKNYVDRFEKKIHDLMLSRMISIQMAPQIRLIQNNNNVLIEKIQSSIVNSIPLWKNQIVIALGLANSKSALEAQKQVSNMTNELLKKNSEMLKQGSLEIAEESEKSTISIETIRKTNSDLIATINGVIDITNKGRADRIAAEAELVKMEGDFKTALLEAKKRA